MNAQRGSYEILYDTEISQVYLMSMIPWSFTTLQTKWLLLTGDESLQK